MSSVSVTRLPRTAKRGSLSLNLKQIGRPAPGCWLRWVMRTFLSGHFAYGVGAFEQALSCPRGFSNPFIHLRLGQCHLEQADLDMAAEHLARAYMLEGKEIYAREDAKYFEFLKTRLSLPASGEWRQRQNISKGRLNAVFGHVL